MDAARSRLVTHPILRDVDRRRHPRAPTLYHLIMHVHERKRIAVVEDISLGGIAVFAVDPPAPGTAVLLAFPKRDSGPGRMVGVAGRIVRIAGTGEAGIMFDSGQERVVKRILRFLPALEAPKPRARRSKVRVKAGRKPR